MSFETEPLSLVISKKSMLGSRHQVVYPDQNPYADLLYEFFAAELRLSWIYHTIRSFDKSHALGLPESLLGIMTEAQPSHFKSARAIKKVLNRQRYVVTKPKQNFKRAYSLTLYSTLAFPLKAREKLVFAFVKSLERNLQEKYRKFIDHDCSSIDRLVLNANLEQCEKIVTSLLQFRKKSD